jgi:hypothetical protein
MVWATERKRASNSHIQLQVRLNHRQDCTGAVPMGVFRVQSGNLDLFKICNLHIPEGLFESWFESMPGSQY